MVLQSAVHTTHGELVSGSVPAVQPAGGVLPPFRQPPQMELLQLWLFGQTMPQPPQLFLSLAVLVSQPSSAMPPGGLTQLPKPALQVEVHRPPAQALAATLAPEQARAQAPQ